jgi:hypothetical protein
MIAASGFDISKFSSTARVVGRVRGCLVAGELFFCFYQRRGMAFVVVPDPLGSEIIYVFGSGPGFFY